ncbi:Protein N-acetyltransferase, RimJ/RimL family [Ferrimonas sediminum]|uniref:Protein N-acetyltransferase, RimJ/RimL family n=1 Tax=Ferrimonas sediminum TaxID=718193 RepID=A0A1G8ULX0_9GAMM|nr:GNAT family N-acetyltransferase [Ferrimonas sediminum]SDJ53990.1 Protein N-acetyltransferase, RimJ/RimL family [Ferrimonas sediminum]
MLTPAALSADEASRYHTLLQTHSGTEVALRAIRPDDKYQMLDIYPTLSPRTLYMRFFRVIDAPSLEDIARYTTVDFALQLAFVVTLGPEQRMVAAGRLIRATAQSKVAELSCLVVDDCQNRGIGSVLVSELFKTGHRWGVDQVIALVHSENHPMLRLLKNQGYPCEMLYDEGEFTVTLDISQEPTQANSVSYQTSIGAMHQVV